MITRIIMWAKNNRNTRYLIKTSSQQKTFLKPCMCDYLWDVWLIWLDMQEVRLLARTTEGKWSTQAERRGWVNKARLSYNEFALFKGLDSSLISVVKLKVSIWVWSATALFVLSFLPCHRREFLYFRSCPAIEEKTCFKSHVWRVILGYNCSLCFAVALKFICYTLAVISLVLPCFKEMHNWQSWILPDTYKRGCGLPRRLLYFRSCPAIHRRENMF